MSDVWYEIAWINFHDAILHGQKHQDEVRIDLSKEQIERVQDLNERHRAEMQELLGSFVP